MKLHRLLKRQLSKFDFESETLRKIEGFLGHVNSAYLDFDSDIKHLENILEESSKELFEANNKLKNNVRNVTDTLEMVTTNLSEVVFRTDRHGRWTYLNPAWENLTGYTIDESLNKPYSDFFRNSEGIALLDYIKPESLRRDEFEGELQFVSKNGMESWIEVRGRLIKKDGEIEGVVGTIMDISNLKETQVELQYSRDKEKMANKAKDNFLSTMSHEIRTPLNAIIGISHLLLMEDPKDEQLESLQALKYSSEHLLNLVNDILDFNKIESGALELEEEEFSLDHILNGIQATLNQKAEEKRLKFTIKKDDLLPSVVKGDSTRFAQILTNLVNNAIKFTKEGKVTLDLEIKEKTDDQICLTVKVEDTGIGIAKDKQADIFKSFTQASSATTRKYGGSGLGLAICKRLLELMGSELKVQSELGKGSIFYFDLWVGKSEKFNSESQAHRMAMPSFSGLQGMKILVVEDHKMNILVIQRFFNKWELDYDIAENGQIGVDMASANEYDLILMDLQMPVMNGYDAARLIRSSEKDQEKSIPIYALSASAAADVKKEVLEIGMNGHISKPFNPTDLYQTLKNHHPRLSKS